MSGRFRLIAVAVAVAAIAISVLRNHRDNTVKTPGLSISVLVAKKPISSGTTGRSIRQGRRYTIVEIPRNQVRVGAIVSPSQLSKKVALTNIGAGQQLTVSEFGPSPR
jgi:hypothetical protein